MENSNVFQQHYQAFKNCELLWFDDTLFSYPQNQIDFLEELDLNKTNIQPNLRLGKYVEQFFSLNIQQHPNYNLLLENYQVQNPYKRTLGELDYIVQTPTEIQHIELTCKFYLYKTDIQEEFERWVGPNLRDSWVEKLYKLKTKQFPLLHLPETKSILNSLGLSIDDISQQVHFKANLYVPYNLQDKQFSYLNNKCVKGFYISQNQLQLLPKNALFFVPSKQNWLLEPSLQQNWFTFETVWPSIKEQLLLNHSPLVWLKHNNTFQAFFITFW